MYSVEQRIVSLSVLSSLGWLSAQIYIGKINIFLDAVNSMPPFFRLANVAFQNGHALRFLALQRSSAQVIIPHESSDLIVRKNQLETEVKRIGCLLPSGTIEGNIHVPPNIRVSDYMVKRNNFFALYDASGELWQEEGQSQPELFRDSPTVLVNAPTLVGVTEL